MVSSRTCSVAVEGISCNVIAVQPGLPVVPETVYGCYSDIHESYFCCRNIVTILSVGVNGSSMKGNEAGLVLPVIQHPSHPFAGGLGLVSIKEYSILRASTLPYFRSRLRDGALTVWYRQVFGRESFLSKL